MDSYDILVIFLSVALAVLLTLSIIAMVYVIKALKSIRHITQKAESIADNVDAVGEFFKKSAGPAAFTKLITNIYESFKNKGDKK